MLGAGRRARRAGPPGAGRAPAQLADRPPGRRSRACRHSSHSGPRGLRATAGYGWMLYAERGVWRPRRRLPTLKLGGVEDHRELCRSCAAREGRAVDDGVCAVPPGVDPGRYARLLARVHDALLSGDRPPAPPRRLVARSWGRVRRHGVNPDLGEPPELVDLAEVERRRRCSPLSRVLPELRASLTSIADDARHVMVITDAHG